MTEISEVKLFNLRAEDFFKIKNLLDVVDLFFPRRSSAGVSVLPSHGAALPAQVRPTLGCGSRGKKGNKNRRSVFKIGMKPSCKRSGESRWSVLLCCRTMWVLLQVTVSLLPPSSSSFPPLSPSSSSPAVWTAAVNVTRMEQHFSLGLSK